MTDVAQTVIEALSTCPECTGWGSLDAAAVTVKDISGGGGSKTYSVTAPEGASVVATPARVCYHKLCEDSVPMEGRMKTAQEVLSAAGLAPKRLVTSPGGSWIEVFTETAEVEHFDKCTAYAKLLAGIHKIPTGWFDAHRAAVYGANPRLAEAEIPLTSHLWIFSARNVLPGASATAPRSPPATPDATKPGSENWSPEAFRAYADLGAAKPRHPAAKRLVTLHGDFHFGNLLYRNEDQGGPLACDFEFTSAGAAAWDLSFCCACHFWGRAERHVFLKTYLEEMGEDPEEDYETFEADVALGMFPTWVAGCYAFVGWDMGGTTGAAVCSPRGEPARVKQFAAEFRASPALRQQASCSEKGAVQVYKRISSLQPTMPSRAEDPVVQKTSSSALRKVEVGRVMSWSECHAHAEKEGGRLATTVELLVAGISVDYDQWTPVTATAEDQQTGRRDGVSEGSENAWANIGPRRYLIEYPAWGLDAEAHPWKKLTYFYISAGEGDASTSTEKSHECAVQADSLWKAGGLYEIEPCHAPGMRIGVTGRNKNGSKLQQWPSNGSNAQKFKAHQVGEYFVFEALCAPGRAIDNCGGCKVPCHLWEHYNLGNYNTHWKLEAAKADGCFSVIARPYGGHRWDIEGASKDEGATLRTWSNEEEVEGANADHQKFKFIPTARKAFDGLEAVRVDFSDPSRPSKKLLSQFSAKFEVNKVTAMVGSGSTTAIHLLLGFYEPTAGQILMPGEPEHKAVVSQETSLFLAGATIEESITSGIPGYTQEALLEAARSAHALQFIQGFSDGFQTTVGERGVSLSGSQKQRLAIARAILRKPTLLIVDEASTSALDSESSEEVQALDNLMDGVGPKCTVIVLAHRLSTLTKADTVLVLADGAVVEQGGHPELLQQSGVYANLIAHQL